MSVWYRKSFYRCRAPLCKHENLVYEKLDPDNNVIDVSPAWKHRCGKCGCGSLDLIYQLALMPKKS